MKRAFHILFRILFLVLFFIFFLWLLKRQSIAYQDLLRLNPYLLFFWSLAMLGNWFVSGEKLRTVLGHLKVSLPSSETLQIAMATSLLNYLPFQAGAAARGTYLYKKYQLSVAKFISLTATTYLTMVLTQCALGMIFCMFQIHLPNIQWVLIAFLIPFSLALALGFLRLPVFLTKGKFEILAVVHEEFLQMLRKPKLMSALISLEIALLIVETLKTKITFTMLYPINAPTWIACAMMSAFSIPSVILNLTPAGLGIRESAMSLIAKAYGFPLEKAFLVGSLDRVLTLIMVFIFGLLATWMLSAKLSRQKKS